jgi:hypothetical protein
MFCGALAALVELLDCVWAGMFFIAARCNSAGGDALMHSQAEAKVHPPLW